MEIKNRRERTGRILVYWQKGIFVYNVIHVKDIRQIRADK
jgi:hypothetical protein